MGRSVQRVEIAMSVVCTHPFFVKAFVALVLTSCSTAFAGTAQNPLVERIEDVGSKFYNRYGKHYPQAARDCSRQFPDQSF